jgi:hypothetical protein
MALADAPVVVPEAVSLLGGRAQGEISTSQLEVASSVLTTLADVRREVGDCGADAAAQRPGCRILPRSSGPRSRQPSPSSGGTAPAAVAAPTVPSRR